MIRPRTLRRYVARRFLLTIIGTFGLCAVLIFMIDIVELLRQAGKFGRVPSLRIAWMALLRLPAYTEILMPFAVLVGTIGALLLLSRKSELTVMRAAGMSVWQFLRPGLLVAAAIGILSTVAYNPMAAAARVESERLFAEAFGREMTTVLKSDGHGAWLRQDGLDGATVIHAGAVGSKGMQLTKVAVFQFDAGGRFVERIDALRANLKERHWELEEATVFRTGLKPETYSAFTISTYLTPERVADAIGSSFSSSFWELPGLIEVAEKASLPSHRLKTQYQQLLSRPALLVVMVLLGATVSLRSFRGGGIQTMVITGMIGGFGFFLLSEVSRQVGVAGLASPVLAIWIPIAVAGCVSLLVLFRQEDG
ncbi:MAG TPA: LPS export ABC transporter permease LptG [Hyphomicrobiaceae bacterium]|nr:LPS export ABC transporter permease LptG [Hyphomicrobiaceae bacterium]